LVARGRKGRGTKSSLLASSVAFLAVSLGLAGAAAAQTTSAPTVTFNAQTFHPVVGPSNAFTVEGTAIGRTRFPMAAVLFEFAGRPLRLILADGTTFASTVSAMATAHVMPGFAATRWLALSVDVPIVAYQSFDQRTPDSQVPVTPSVAGLGDVRLMTKFRIKNNDDGGFGFAVIPQFTFPSGSADDLRGDNTVGIEPRLAADYRFRNGTFIALNVGYYLRTYNRTVDYGLTRVADQLRYGLGVGVPVVKGFGFVGEVSGAASLSKFTGGSFYTPVEGYLAARYSHQSGFEITAGGGAGCISAPGSPQYRAILSLGYVPRAKASERVKDEDRRQQPTTDATTEENKPVRLPGDLDGDGLVGAADECPRDAGPARTKGCPDRDGDGVVDWDDKCKDQPGPADHAGCPVQVADTDRDGIPDKQDKCPTVAGLKENDGCPDQDADKDGLVDRLDKCPTVAGPKSLDGCPPIEVKDTEIKMQKAIKFVAGSEELDPDAKLVIRALALAVHNDPAIKKVKITVSASGDKKAAKKLVAKRAKALAIALDNAGLPKSQLLIEKAAEPGEDSISRVELDRGQAQAAEAGDPDEKPKKKKKKKKKTDE
jgi:outer membrane protein OmpA-like peptidoglycan-associated protein